MSVFFDQLADNVVRPVLLVLGAVRPGLMGEAAVNLLLGTAAQETQGRFLVQEGGPAIGFWQIEPATHQAVLTWLKANDPALLAATLSLRAGQPGDIDAQLINPFYGCAIARILYWSIPAPLPAADDIQGLAAYYKRWFNTPSGAATVAEFEANYAALVAA